MSKPKFTPGPWRAHVASYPDKPIVRLHHQYEGGGVFTEVARVNAGLTDADAIAHLIAAAPDMYEALTLHQAWADSENAGPDYGSLTRDTHPDGERIWRQWWEANLDLCDRAQAATQAALRKARGES